MRLFQTGAWARAISYVVLSTIVGLAAVFFAAWIARRF
jgi:fluoride ion exporter CrcB/FEX